MLKKGEVLDKRYLIDEPVSCRDSYIMFRAFDLKADNAERSVKAFFGNNEELCMILSECALISELYNGSTNYNFIPNIIHRVKNNNAVFIVMEYIDGINMGYLLQNTSIPYKKIIDYAMDICTFMSFMHKKNKLYCNMKPDSIIILKNDEKSEAIENSGHFSNIRITEFRSVINKGEHITGYTPEYAAPEQYLDSFSGSTPDERADIFNIGATLYHMATGRIPGTVFSDHGASSGEVRPSYERFIFTSHDAVSSGLRRIIQKCVNDNPDQRYLSCSALYRDLVALAEHRHLKKAVILAAAAVILAAGGLLTSYESKQLSKNQFQYYMDIAKKSSEPEEKLENYISAINIEPDNLDAYVQMIDACSFSKYDNDLKDTLFTSEEKTKILQVIHKNKQLLISEKKYEKVAFELGKLIWYHDDYGLTENSDNKITRMRDAAQYFGEAISTENGETLSSENLEMAQTYYNIGMFYDSVLTSSAEKNRELYINFWNDLHNMMNYVIDSNSKNDLIRLETYRTALDALDSYSSYFKNSGYTYDQQTEFFELIKKYAEECNPDKNTRELYTLKQNIQERYSQCLQSIEMSFSKEMR